jgi:hypothetical protein
MLLWQNTHLKNPLKSWIPYINDKKICVHLGSCSYLDFLCVFLWTSFGEVNMNYKSFEINRFINSNLWTTFKRDEHIMHCDFASFDCMSHTVILKVLQYDK